MNSTRFEDTWGAHVEGSDIHLTALGDFDVSSGLSGDLDDIYTCISATTGASTACASFAIFFDGDASGYANERIDGIYIDFETPSVIDSARAANLFDDNNDAVEEEDTYFDVDDGETGIDAPQIYLPLTPR